MSKIIYYIPKKLNCSRTGPNNIMLSKCELQYLQGEKRLSDSYERKIRCIIRKKIRTLQKELPLLAQLIPLHQLVNNKVNHTQSHHSLGATCNLDATEFSNTSNNQIMATEFSSKEGQLRFDPKSYNDKVCSLQIPINANFSHREVKSVKKKVKAARNSINNPLELIKNTACSGGVETSDGHTIRLSISPSQGDDPGFKSRPEHPSF